MPCRIREVSLVSPGFWRWLPQFCFTFFDYFSFITPGYKWTQHSFMENTFPCSHLPGFFFFVCVCVCYSVFPFFLTISSVGCSLMEVLQCKRYKECAWGMGGCTVRGIHGMAQSQAPRTEVRKCCREGRECFCYTELHVPDQSNSSSNCFASRPVRATNCPLTWAVSGKWGVNL